MTILATAGVSAAGDPEDGGVPYSFTACDVELIIEGQGDVAGVSGAYLAHAIANTFRGSSESNLHGGVNLAASSSRNTFINMFNELNGDAGDWLVAGDYNTFINCTGTGDETGSFSTISGNQNRFIGGKFHNATISGDRNTFEGVHLRYATTVDAAAAYTKFDRSTIEGLTDNSVTTILENCVGPLSTATAKAVTFATNVADNGGSYQVCQVTRGEGGFVRLEGVFKSTAAKAVNDTVMTVPTGFRTALTGFSLWTGWNNTTNTPVGFVTDSTGAVMLRSAIAANDIISLGTPSWR
jgi:hypothetical protein